MEKPVGKKQSTLIRLAGYGYEAGIRADRGANLISLVRPVWGAHSVRTPEDNRDYLAQPFFWGTPLLFPPNRISGARFVFEEREYAFPITSPKSNEFIHGTLHEMPFRLMARTEESALLRFEASEEAPYLTFPHAFRAEVSYSLSAEGLRQTLTVTNLSGQNMPVGIGYHTSFALPLTAEGDPEDVLLSLDATEEIVRGADYLPTGEVRMDTALLRSMNNGTLRPSSSPLSIHLKMGNTRRMVLTDLRKGLRVVYGASESFGYWTLFNGGHRDFVCVEPQSWITNSPNAPFDRNRSGFAFLRPNESREYTTTLAIEKK